MLQYSLLDQKVLFFQRSPREQDLTATRGYSALRNCLLLLSLSTTAGKHSAKTFKLLKKGGWTYQTASPDLLRETMNLLYISIQRKRERKDRKVMIFPHLKGPDVTRMFSVQLQRQTLVRTEIPSRMVRNVLNQFCLIV